MSKAIAIEYLDLVISDCEAGEEYASNNEYIPWDADAWMAMRDLLEEVRRYVLTQPDPGLDYAEVN
jgi:hypothetical protein